MARLFSHWHRLHHRDPRGRIALEEGDTSLSIGHLVRITVAAAIGIYFFGAALVSDDPAAMLAGTFPIGWIAVECAWVALRPQRKRGQR
jgi:hypothetical protein